MTSSTDSPLSDVVGLLDLAAQAIARELLADDDSRTCSKRSTRDPASIDATGNQALSSIDHQTGKTGPCAGRRSRPA